MHKGVEFESLVSLTLQSKLLAPSLKLSIAYFFMHCTRFLVMCTDIQLNKIFLNAGLLVFVREEIVTNGQMHIGKIKGSRA